MLTTCLTPPTLSERRFFNNLPRLASELPTICPQSHYSAGRNDDVPRRSRLGSLDAHVREACLPERGDNVVGRSRCKDVRGHSHAIHPLLRNEADDHTSARQKHPTDFGEPCVERAPEVDRIDGAYFSER